MEYRNLKEYSKSRPLWLFFVVLAIFLLLLAGGIIYQKLVIAGMAVLFLITGVGTYLWDRHKGRVWECLLSGNYPRALREIRNHSVDDVLDKRNRILRRTLAKVAEVEILMLAGKTDKAKSKLVKLVTIVTERKQELSGVRPNRIIARALAMQARISMVEGDHEESLALCERALKKYKLWSDALICKYENLVAMANFAAALWDDLLQYDDVTLRMLGARALCALGKGEKSVALELLQAGSEIAFHELAAEQALFGIRAATIHAELGDIEQSEAQLTAASQADPQGWFGSLAGATGYLAKL